MSAAAIPEAHARRAFLKPRSLFVNRPALCGAKLIRERMVDDILGLAAVNDQSVTRDDLLALGWTPQQLDAHGDAARRAAADAATRVVR